MEKKKRLGETDIKDRSTTHIPLSNYVYTEDEEYETALLPSESRITFALSGSLSEAKLEGDIKTVDTKGKPVRFTAMQKRIILAIQAYISKRREEPVIKQYALKLYEGTPLHERDYITADILLSDLSKLLNGDKEAWKTAPQERILTEIEKIAMIKIQYSYKGYSNNSDGEKMETTVSIADPYFTVGRIVTIQVENHTAKKVTLFMSRVFFDGIENKYIPIYPDYWRATKSNNRAIYSDEFLSLSYLVFRKAYRHFFPGLKRAEEQIRKDKIIDPEKIQQIKERVLTNKGISFSDITIMLEKDINEGTNPRVKKFRFFSSLWEAMWALINYGIITSKSHIDYEKETIKLVYNPEYLTDKRKDSKPSGEWIKNPYEKYGARKKH